MAVANMFLKPYMFLWCDNMYLNENRKIKVLSIVSV